MPERIKVTCLLCDHSFYHDEYNENSKDDICSCDNLKMTILKRENSRYKYYIAAEYSRERPKVEVIKIDL